MSPPPSKETRLVILGAATALLEILDIIADINKEAPRFKVIGALDDDAALHGKEVGGVPVLGPLSKAATMEKDISFVFGICAYTRRLLRIKLLESLGLSRDRFVNIVHPDAQISLTASLGRGCIIYKGVVVMAQSRLGDFVYIACNSVVAPACRFDDFAMAAPMVFVGGKSHVGSGAFLGASSSVMEKTRIAPGAMVGLASVPLRYVPP